MPHELLMENAIDKRGCVNHEAGVEFAMWAVRPHGWKLSFLLEGSSPRRAGAGRCSNNCWCFTHATAVGKSSSREPIWLTPPPPPSSPPPPLLLVCLSIVCQSVIRSIIIDYSIVLNFFFSFFINIATKKFISVVLCSRINKYLYRFYYTI